MTPTHHHLLHALEILSVFLCAHHFWPKGITYSEKEVWEHKKPHRARRSKSTRGRHPEDRRNRNRNRDRDTSRNRGSSVYADEEVFVPRGIYRGDGGEFSPEMQAQERERHLGGSGSRRGGGGDSDAGRSSGSGSGQGRNRRVGEESRFRYGDYEERGDDERYGYRNKRRASPR